jgi:similar to spore coat protein
MIRGDKVLSQLMKLTKHEMLELHEIINSEVTCLKKLQVNLDMVSDPDLKAFMEESIDLKKDTLTKYQDFLNRQEQQH